MIKNILVFGHSSIGDACYDLVVINPLRRQFPQAKISFFTSPRAKDIAGGYCGLDEVISFDKHAKDRGVLGRLRVMRALIRARFDLAIVLNNTQMPYLLGISGVWRARKYSNKASLRHVVDIYLEFLRNHDIAAPTAVFNFVLGKGEEDFCNAFLAKEGIHAKDRLIGIFPLAAWSLKNWPIDKWNELAEILQGKYGFKVIAFGKKGANPYSQKVQANISRKIIFAETPTLKQAMALIKRCSIFVGPDSSLLHLASCMGTETIGLYGPTSREYIYPYFHSHNIIVPRKNLDCMPCYPGHKFCQCKEVLRPGICMESIHLDDVLAMIRRRLGL